MRCLRGPLYSMEAEILHWEGQTEPEPEDVEQEEGRWVSYQDPVTFEILNKWVSGTPDDPSTPDVDESSDVLVTFPCMARGIIDGGIRVAGTTERFGEDYENIDFVRLKVPAWVTITKRDRITNIRETAGGKVLWKNEESDGRATVFNVNGVTPVLDGFNRHIENFILLERTNE